MHDQRIEEAAGFTARSVAATFAEVIGVKLFRLAEILALPTLPKRFRIYVFIKFTGIV